MQYSFWVFGTILSASLQTQLLLYSQLYESVWLYSNILSSTNLYQQSTNGANIASGVRMATQTGWPTTLITYYDQINYKLINSRPIRPIRCDKLRCKQPTGFSLQSLLRRQFRKFDFPKLPCRSSQYQHRSPMWSERRQRQLLLSGGALYIILIVTLSQCSWL